MPPRSAPAPLTAFVDWLESRGKAKAASLARAYGRASPLGFSEVLPGPVGESNLYTLHPRGPVRMEARSEEGLLAQIAAVLATGSGGIATGLPLPADLPTAVKAALGSQGGAAPIAAVLVEGGDAGARAVLAEVAQMDGAIVAVCCADPGQPLPYPVERPVEEVATSINTTAAGGNASLMAIG